MAKATGMSTKEKPSSNSNIKDILKKGIKSTPMGMTAEAAAKAAKALKSKMEKAEQKPVDPRGKAKPKKFERRLRIEKPKNKFKREPFKPENFSVRPQRKKDGGRIGLKAGSKGCKLAKRGRGRAYGKNS